MNTFNVQKAILDLYKDNTYQELNSYYNQTTVFNIMRSERSENRYSAILCWLLSPEGSHGLKDLPLKKLLSLYAYKCSCGEYRNSLLSGDYGIVHVEDCTTEKVLRDITMGKERRRIDIWIDITVSVDNKEVLLPILIENKVFASENNGQTEAYHNAMTIYRAHKEKQGLKCMPVEIYLTPEGAPKCKADFTHITYQELLDYVIEPVSELSTDCRSEIMIKDFIKNLAIPTSAEDSDADRNDAVKSIANSILAVSGKEREKLCELYNNHKALIDLTLVANGDDSAPRLFPGYEDLLTSEIQETLTGFWNSNFNLLITILYICRSTILPEKEKELLKLFVSSRRDNSRYVIEIKDDNGNWEIAPDYPKPMSKGMTVAAFFTLWNKRRENSSSLEQLRKIFPSSLSQYYSRFGETQKWGNSVVWELCAGPDDEELNKNDKSQYRRSYVKAENGYMVKLTDAAGWDFYSDLKVGCSDNAVIVKMWRKDDFDRFMEHIKKPFETTIRTPNGPIVKQNDIFSDIRIVEFKKNEL